MLAYYTNIRANRLFGAYQNFKTSNKLKVHSFRIIIYYINIVGGEGSSPKPIHKPGKQKQTF